MTGAIISKATDFLFRAVDSEKLTIVGASKFGSGASIELYGKDHSNDGSFFISTIGRNSSSSLAGLPDGKLLWNSKEVERVNSSGSNYIRYENGLQIVFGGSVGSHSGVTVTLPVAFKDRNYAVTTSYNADNITASVIPVAGNHTSTSFKIYGHDWSVAYIAVGFWK